MKIEILYPHVVAAADSESKGPEFYAPYHKRFIKSFMDYPPDIDCRLKVILCGVGDSTGARSLYAEIYNHGIATYEGKGWDLGAHQEISGRSSCDVVVCLVTPAYFLEHGWICPIVEAFEKYGDGLYGTSASYQNMPHIRTGCFAFSPSAMRQYPNFIDSREKTCYFESGQSPTVRKPEWSFTNWMLAQGKPVKLVTRGACYDLPDWRKPDNIFRRGNQSNALARDRHFDIFDAAGAEDKAVLANLADVRI